VPSCPSIPNPHACTARTGGGIGGAKGGRHTGDNRTGPSEAWQVGEGGRRLSPILRRRLARLLGGERLEEPGLPTCQQLLLEVMRTGAGPHSTSDITFDSLRHWGNFTSCNAYQSPTARSGFPVSTLPLEPGSKCAWEFRGRFGVIFSQLDAPRKVHISRDRSFPTAEPCPPHAGVRSGPLRGCGVLPATRGVK